MKLHFKGFHNQSGQWLENSVDCCVPEKNSKEKMEELIDKLNNMTSDTFQGSIKSACLIIGKWNINVNDFSIIELDLEYEREE